MEGSRCPAKGALNITQFLASPERGIKDLFQRLPSNPVNSYSGEVLERVALQVDCEKKSEVRQQRTATTGLFSGDVPTGSRN
jgi:hypothetical protein